jgi:hypothetical protein
LSYDPPATYPTYPTSSGNATAALVLGIIGLLGNVGSCCCCLSLFLGLCSPVAWYMGHKELQAIAAGLSSPAGAGNAKAGMVCGIIGTIVLALYVIAIVIYVAFVGFAVALDAMKKGGLPLPQ